MQPAAKPSTEPFGNPSAEPRWNLPWNLLAAQNESAPENLSETPKTMLPQNLGELARATPKLLLFFFFQKKRSNIRGPKSCGPSLDDGDYCRIRCGCDVQHLHLEIHVESQAHHLSRESQVKGVDPKTAVKKGTSCNIPFEAEGKNLCYEKPAKRNNSCLKPTLTRSNLGPGDKSCG